MGNKVDKPENSNTCYFTGLLFALILFSSAYLRLKGLDEKSIWFDELLQIRIVKLNFSEMLTALRYDQHPPLSYLIGKLFFLFGISDFTARLPSAIFGTGAVALIFHYGKRLFSPMVGLSAALFLALNIGAITQAQYARPYSLLLFFSVWNYGVLFCILAGLPVKWARLQLVLSGVLVLYTDTFGLAVIIGGLAPIFVRCIYSARHGNDKNFSIKTIVFYYLSVFLIYLPWLHILSQQVKRTASLELTWTLIPARDFLMNILSYFAYGYSRIALKHWPDWPLLFVSLLFLISALWSARKNWKGPAFVSILVGTLLTSWLLSFRYRVFSARHFIFLLPILFLSAGPVLQSLFEKLIILKRNWPRRFIKILFLGSIVLLHYPLLSDYYNEGYHLEPYKGDWKGVAAFLMNNLSSDDQLLILKDGFHQDLIDWYLPPEKRKFEMKVYKNLKDLVTALSTEGRKFTLLYAANQLLLSASANRNSIQTWQFLNWSLSEYQNIGKIEQPGLQELMARGMISEISKRKTTVIAPERASYFHGTLLGPQMIYRGRLAMPFQVGDEVAYQLVSGGDGRYSVTIDGASTCHENTIGIEINGQTTDLKLPYCSWGTTKAEFSIERGVQLMNLHFKRCVGDSFLIIKSILINN